MHKQYLGLRKMLPPTKDLKRDPDAKRCESTLLILTNILSLACIVLPSVPLSCVGAPHRFSLHFSHIAMNEMVLFVIKRKSECVQTKSLIIEDFV